MMHHLVLVAVVATASWIGNSIWGWLVVVGWLWLLARGVR